LSKSEKEIDILLVEDSITDAELTLEALQHGKVANTVHHVRDGEEAMCFLRNEAPFENASRPDLVLLDLNMPKMDGREVLRQMRADDSLKIIPVVVMTTSEADQDIIESYGLHANSYIVKPVNLNSFFEVVREVNNFWLRVVALPPKDHSRDMGDNDLAGDGLSGNE